MPDEREPDPVSPDITASSIWFPAPDYGMPDATAEELAAEPEDVKALRMLRVLRAYTAQGTHPFAAVKLDGNELAVMSLGHLTALLDAAQWVYDWQRRAVNLLTALRDDLEHELTVTNHLEAVEQLLVDEFEDGDDD
jgi:hypothetical protein